MPATFLALSVAIVPTGQRAGSMGPLSSSGEPRPASVASTGWLGGKGRRYLSPPQVFRGAGRGEGSPSRQAPSMSPLGEGCFEGEEAGRSTGTRSPLCCRLCPPASSPLSWSCRQSHSGPLALPPNGPKHVSPCLQGPSALTVSSAGRAPLPHLSPPFVSCFICLYAGCRCRRGAVPDKPV